MHIVAVINQKGGVGKTTSCANLSAALARKGHKVLLVDLDPQAHLSISFDKMPPPGEPSLYTMLAGHHRLDEVVRETGVPNLRIVPTNLDLSGAETEFAGEIGRETLLSDALRDYSTLEDSPDIVLFDCPPSLGLMSINALVAAQHVLIPLQAEFFALQGMAQLLEIIERVQRRLNPNLELLGILVGLFSKQRNLSREVITELKGHFGEVLFDSLIRVNVRLAEAPSHGMTIFDYAPESGGAEDFNDAAEELEQRLGITARNASTEVAASLLEEEEPIETEENQIEESHEEPQQEQVASPKRAAPSMADNEAYMPATHLEDMYPSNDRPKENSDQSMEAGSPSPPGPENRTVQRMDDPILDPNSSKIQILRPNLQWWRK